MKRAISYKALLLTPLFGAFYGCGVLHTNVVKEVSDNQILVKDVDTQTERIIVFKNNKTKYIYPGDTVDIKAIYYEKERVLSSHNRTIVYCDGDSIDARRANEVFNHYLYQMRRQNGK